MSDIKKSLVIPIKVLKQGTNYLFSCIELDVIEESPNFYLGLEQTKNVLIQRVVQKVYLGEALPRFNIDKAIKQGAILVELPSSCLDDSLERIALTIPKNLLVALDAITINRSKLFTQILQQFLEQKK